MTPEQLKASILQYAIQGKLVDQRPEEGTAEELYKQIQEEKQKLIKEGKIKKEKPLADITEDEMPFDIPDNWKWVRVGNMGSWASGATPSRTNPQFYGGNIPWLKTGDLNDGFIEEVPEYITELALEKTSVRLNPEGSVLMAMYGATIGKLGILNRPMTTNQACCACITFSGIYNKYLFYFLMSQRPSYIGMAEGGAQPNISKEKIIASVMPLPPLNEQYRIVNKIEELLPFVDRYAEAYEKLEKFSAKFPENMKKSILQYAIQGKLVEQRPEEGTAEELYKLIQEEKSKLIKEGIIKNEKPLAGIVEDETPFDIPESWKWVRVGDVCSGFEYGTAKRSTEQGKRIVLRMGNIQDGKIVYDNLVYSNDDEDITKYNLVPGDLLFNRTNSKEWVGKTAIYKGEFDAIYAGYLVRFRPISIDGDYLNYVMQSKYYWYFCQRERTDAIGQSNINAQKLKKFMFPLPPLEEQKRIVAKIEELLPYCDALIK